MNPSDQLLPLLSALFFLGRHRRLLFFRHPTPGMLFRLSCHCRHRIPIPLRLLFRFHSSFRLLRHIFHPLIDLREQLFVNLRTRPLLNFPPFLF